MEGWGRLLQVNATSGSTLLVGDSTVADSVIPEFAVRPESENRDRVDVVLNETLIVGGVTVHAGTTGTVYVHLQDSEMNQVVLDSSAQSAGIEVALLRSVVNGGESTAIVLDRADNYGLTVTNSLIHGNNQLLSTAADGQGLAQDARLELFNNVFIGGDITFEQSPQCEVISTTSLSLRNNVFIDVGLNLLLLQDQEFQSTHNLFMDAACIRCEVLTTDACVAIESSRLLSVVNTTGSASIDAEFVDLNQADPAASDLHLAKGSPAINAGVSQWSDPDGSRSDIGMYGGPDAAE
jgi:hypothetical protein